MYRKTFEVTGYTYDGAAYCPACKPDVPDDELGVIFLGTEWDYPGPCCDECREPFEGDDEKAHIRAHVIDSVEREED